MGRVSSVAMAGLLPLMTLAPWALQAQPVYQPTQPQAQPTADQQQPPAAVQPNQPQPAPVPAAAAPDQQSPQAAQPQQPAPTPYSQAQLDQMLAPVALYPDTLLGDILMASTYPIQVVEAQRWLQDPHNASIHGDSLVEALQPMTWDPSVKSLVPFPQIVKQMNDQLDWTQSLGTAFTYQQADVMERVQALRHQAEDCGKLTTTAQLKVSHEGPAVVIEPANPSVVYVPVYNPAVVYGAWAYPAYEPFYFPPPPGFFVGPVGIGIGFSIGFGIVDPFWGWGHPVWGAHSIVVNNAYYSRISYNHGAFAGGTWSHSGPVGFHGPAAAAGFHGPVGAAGFHGSVGAAGFHGSTAAAFHGAGATHAAAGAARASAGRGAASRGFGGSRGVSNASARGFGSSRAAGGRAAGGGFGHAASGRASGGGGGFGHAAAPAARSSFSRGGGGGGGFHAAAAPRGGGGGRSFSGGSRGGGGRGGGGHGGGGGGHHR